MRKAAVRRSELTDEAWKRIASLLPENGRRGGLSTKVHLVCDGKGRPLSVVVTPGQRHESTQLEAVLDAIRVVPLGVGRPRKRPERLIADRGYSYPSCRKVLRKRGIPHTIPEQRDQRERRAGRPGRKPGFDASAYRRRNVVERCVTGSSSGARSPPGTRSERSTTGPWWSSPR